MNIDSLRYFVEVANHKNISVVAKNFHITQSALSQQLSKLEQRLNSKLLERSNKGVILTKEGELLLKYSETILNTYDKMVIDLNTLHQNKTNITIEAVESLSTSILPYIISIIKKEKPYYSLNLETNNSCSMSNILNDISDIYISYTHTEKNDDLISKKLYSDKILLVANTTFPLNTINNTEFTSLPFIINTDKCPLTSSIDEALNSFMATLDTLDVVYSTNSYFSAINGLKAFNAVTLIPTSIYNTYKNTHNLKVIEVSDFNLSIDMYINYTNSFYKNNKEFIKQFTKLLKNSLH